MIVSPFCISRRRRTLATWLFLVLLSLIASVPALAQTGGQGAIQGTITDPTGAVIPGAAVTATNVGTGVKITRPTSSGGIYEITPLIPGQYIIDVVAKGFEAYKQEKVQIDAMNVTGLNITLKPGAQSETVDVTTAPAQLDTTNATLGGTIQGTEYLDLPLLVSGNQQRDITSFSNLLPGAQPGSRTSVIGGTETRVGEVYVDGLPLTTISQQGDNRPILNVIPLEAIDQIKVVTSGFSAEYQGAGLENYNLKSGTNKYHGTVADYIRNTVFDTWGFSAPWATVTTVVNGVVTKGPQNATANAFGHISKPADHQNELSISVGGPVRIPHLFDGRDKLFFQATVDKEHGISAPVYGGDTIPTVLERTGNFCELLSLANNGCNSSAPGSVNAPPNYAIYDPTTLATCTAHNTGGAPCRYQYGYGAGAGVGTNGNPVLIGPASNVNVIPASELSPQALYMQKFLPAPINGNISNNYAGGIPTGYKNYLYAGKIDYDISPRQRLSAAVSNGRRHAVPYTSGAANLPVPYLAATESTVVGDYIELEHTFTIRPNLVNQVKIGYAYFGGPPTQNSTEGIAQYEDAAIGITGLPAGQASDQFPGNCFNSSCSSGAAPTGANPTNWTQPDITSKTVSHTYDLLDNVEWVLGKHALNIGIQLQDLMENLSTFNTFSSPVTYQWSQAETAQVSGTSYVTATSGFPYASYMLGAVNSTSTTLQPFSDTGERFKPISPYFQDDYKITPKLTLNIGLRWDYMPPFHEALNRWSFLNATATNPYTGNPGTLQFAGNYGGAGVSCGCTTPVKTYWKNFGPRLGFAYSFSDKTVFRGGVAVLYSHGGGTGGAGAVGTGQAGFNQPVSFTANPAGPTAGPVFYLNNSGYNASLNNTQFGGPGYVLPSITAPSATSQLSTGQVGNFVNGAGAFVKSTSGINYADPYYGDRTPTFYYFNFGFQHSFTPNITLTMNYAGSVTHFVAGAGGIRGLQSGEVNPIYFALGAGGTVAVPQYGAGLLTQPATATNLALANAILPGCCAAPYAGFTAAAGTTAGAGFATIAQSLKWMPQYSGTTDTWGVQSANASYNAWEVSVAIRPTHGLTFNLNYTFNKEIDNAGTIRTGYPIPANRILDGVARRADRADRSIAILDLPENLAMFGVYKLPFGKGHIGGDHFLVRAFAQGWELSGITTYLSGEPLFFTSSACSATSLPNQGTCMPDLNPGFSGRNIRINGKWGQGVTATTLTTNQYLQGYVSNTTPGNGITSAGASTPCGTSVGPFCNAGPLMIGDAPRGGAYGVRGPNNFRVTAGLRRTFDITEAVKFTLAVDCQNVLNSVTFGGGGGGSTSSIGQSINAASFGTLQTASSDSRDFQFSGRINF